MGSGRTAAISEPARIADAWRMRAPIQTILFDFGGTLDANGVAWKERFYALYRAEGLDIAAAAFDSSFYAADDPLVGNLSPATDLSGTVHALAANLETQLARGGAGANKPDLSNGSIDGDRGRRVATRFLAQASAAFARNRPVLETLRERYRLGVVANFYGNLEAVCHGAGLASSFAVLVDSHCVGAEKPDPAIFRAALDPLGARPETTVFVGDSLPRDREGARRVGMRFIWMTPEDTAGATRATADPQVEHAVTDLRDLMKILP
jgi:HAD superfamily hydrolase (TIGR01549 family)